MSLFTWFFGSPSHDYGPPKWTDMSGPSLCEQMRTMIASPLADRPDQKPVVKFTGHTAKVKATK